MRFSFSNCCLRVKCFYPGFALWTHTAPTACTPPLPYLERAAVGKLHFLAALGGYGGVAGADEHGGADLQRLPLGGRVDHPVEGVEGGGDGELPQALPPGVGHLGESRRIRALCFGRRRS